MSYNLSQMGNWSGRHIAEGWRHGHVYDDAGKQHPRLAPYEDLSASDRGTTQDTIKTLLALGYRIEPPPAGDALTTDAQTR